MTRVDHWRVNDMSDLNSTVVPLNELVPLGEDAEIEIELEPPVEGTIADLAGSYTPQTIFDAFHFLEGSIAKGLGCNEGKRPTNYWNGCVESPHSKAERSVIASFASLGKTVSVGLSDELLAECGYEVPASDGENRSGILPYRLTA